MKDVTIYTTNYCPYCVRAKALLNQKNISFKEVSVEHDTDLRLEMERLSGRRTVPQIFIGHESVGGFDDLKVLNDAGKLDLMLK